jgi:hypothetical protein
MDSNGFHNYLYSLLKVQEAVVLLLLFHVLKCSQEMDISYLQCKYCSSITVKLL